MNKVIESTGKYGYLALYRGETYEVYANTTLDAQRAVIAELGLTGKRRWEVSVYLALKDGKPYIQTITN